MTKRSSFSGDVSVLPPYLALAAAVDRAFYKDAICRTPLDTPKLAWTAEVKRIYTIGHQIYRGNVLIKMACEVCRHCPVQWECAGAAIEGQEPVGTWGDRIENIHWLGKQDGYEAALDAAKQEGMPVQTLVKNMRAAQKKSGTVDI